MPKRSGFKLLGGALTCPPGFFCMDWNTVCFGILIVLLLVGTILYVTRPQMDRKPNYAEFVHREPEQQPTVIVVQSPPLQEQTQTQTQKQKQEQEPVVTTQTRDPRFAPLSPEQSYETPPDPRAMPSPPLPAGLGAIMPINIQTRGYPDTFQQIGLLTTAGGSQTSASPTRTILPLFGRKLITNRDRWNYYTRTDGTNPVQVPIQFKRRNCDDDIGCEEIMDGDSIGVPVLGQSFIATVYRYSTPRYLPIV